MHRSSAAHLDTAAAAADPEKLAEDARDVATERAESLAAFAPRTPSPNCARLAESVAQDVDTLLDALATMLPEGWTARAVAGGSTECTNRTVGRFSTWYVHANGWVDGVPHIACGTGRTFAAAVASLVERIGGGEVGPDASRSAQVAS